jgi:hypothetical protein
MDEAFMATCLLRNTAPKSRQALPALVFDAEKITAFE